MSSNRELSVAVQMKGGEVLQTQYISDIHTQKCLLKGYLEDTPLIDTVT